MASVNLTKATPADATGRLKQHQIEQWRSVGYTFVSELLEMADVRALANAAMRHFPPPGSLAAESVHDFGSGGALTFPSPENALNRVTLQASLLDAVADLLGTGVTDLRLTQSDVWPKYGRTANAGMGDNADQRIHVDYPNHTLAHPTPWERPEAVEMILYLSDGEGEGGTAVVPRAGEDDPAYRWPIVDSPGIGDLKYINDRQRAESYFAEQRPQLADWRRSLYEREVMTDFRTGDLLLYRHDTWHRGTPVPAGTRRIVHNMTFRRASAEWISTLHTGWAWSAYRDSKFLERLIATASLPQRAVLGFPQPGSDYWCHQTLAAVEARYGVFGMDMAPYRDALLREQ